MVNVNNGVKTELKARTPSTPTSQNGVTIASGGAQHQGDQQAVTNVAVAPDSGNHQTIITLPSLTTSSSQVPHHHQHQTSTVTNGVLVTTTPCYESHQPIMTQQNDQNVELTYLKNFSSQTNQNHFMFHYADFTEIGNNYNPMNGEIEINLDETFTDPNSNHLYTEKT